MALSGKVERYRGRLQMKAPDADVLDRPSESLITGRVVPVHPDRRRGRARDGCAGRSTTPWAGPARSPIRCPPEMRERLGPRRQGHRASPTSTSPRPWPTPWPARERLVFDELFRLEVALAIRKHRQVQEADGIEHNVDAGLVESFVDIAPVHAHRRPATGDRPRSRRDMASSHPMHRLLQGEVGSGKTVVAMAASADRRAGRVPGGGDGPDRGARRAALPRPCAARRTGRRPHGTAHRQLVRSRRGDRGGGGRARSMWWSAPMP